MTNKYTAARTRTCHNFFPPFNHFNYTRFNFDRFLTLNQKKENESSIVSFHSLTRENLARSFSLSLSRTWLDTREIPTGIVPRHLLNYRPWTSTFHTRDVTYSNITCFLSNELSCFVYSLVYSDYKSHKVDTVQASRSFHPCIVYIILSIVRG